MAAAVAVLLAGGTAAGYTLFSSPGAGTQAAVSGSGHASGTSGAARPSGPAAGHAVTVTSGGRFDDPDGIAVASTAFGQNGTLDIVDGNGNPYVFDIASRQIVETLSRSKLGTSGAFLSPDGSTLADPIGAGCADGSTACELMLTEISARQQKPGIETRAFATATVAFKDVISIGDSTLAAIDSIRDGVDLVNLTSGADLGELTDPDHHYIVGTAISRNGQVVATSSNGGTATHTVYIWNVASRTVIKILAVPQDVGFAGTDPAAIGPPLALNRDGTTLAVTDGVTTYVYNTKTRRLISKIPAGLVALSPDGTLIAAVGQTVGEVRLWDVSTGKVAAALPRLPSGVKPTTVAFSADGQSVAVGGNDGTTVVYHLSGE